MLLFVYIYKDIYILALQSFPFYFVDGSQTLLMCSVVGTPFLCCCGCVVVVDVRNGPFLRPVGG